MFLTLGVGGCNSNSFDASKYVKGILDSIYLGGMSAYMETVDVSEEEALKSYEEGVEAETLSLLDAYVVSDASEEMIAKLTDTYKEVYKRQNMRLKMQNRKSTNISLRLSFIVWISIGKV